MSVQDEEGASAYYYAGTQRVPLFPDPHVFAVRFDRDTCRAPAAGAQARTARMPAAAVLAGAAPLAFLPRDGLGVYRTGSAAACVERLHRLDGVAQAFQACRHGRGGGDPLVPTARLLAKFRAEPGIEKILHTLELLGLRILEPLRYAAPNGFLLGCAPGVNGLGALAAANALVEEGIVLFAEPDLVQARHLRSAGAGGPAGTAADPMQAPRLAREWHLHACRVPQAWRDNRGSPAIRIALFDDGVDAGHPEFAGEVATGQPKVAARYDFADGSADASPKSYADRHGTACAGVAGAAGIAVAGVAPGCRLVLARTPGFLAVSEEARMFEWAVDAGADVLGCAWGPAAGTPCPLPTATRLAIRYCLQHGRGGKGTPIFWAAGNGAEALDGDGYAANPDVMAIGACSERGLAAPYGSYGARLFACAPSSGSADERAILTTDRAWPAGYGLRAGVQNGPGTKNDVNDMYEKSAGLEGDGNTDAYREDASAEGPSQEGSRAKGESGKGERGGDGNEAGARRAGPEGDGAYTDRFGGTSAAVPLAAGIAALMLSANPALGAADLRSLLRQSAERIGDPDAYDAAGHSERFGYGRLDAEAAVRAARSAPVAAADAPTIAGPEAWTRTDPPPRFHINPGPQRYYVVEVAADPRLFDATGHLGARTSGNFYGSWSDQPFQVDPTYQLPAAVWAQLRNAPRLWYRVGASARPDDYVDYTVSTTDDMAAMAPSIEIRAGIGAPPRTGERRRTITELMRLVATGDGKPDIEGPLLWDPLLGSPAFRIDPGRAQAYAVELSNDPAGFAGLAAVASAPGVSAPGVPAAGVPALGDPAGDQAVPNPVAGAPEQPPGRGYFSSGWLTPAAAREDGAQVGFEAYIVPLAAWDALLGAARLYYRMTVRDDPQPGAGQVYAMDLTSDAPGLLARGEAFPGRADEAAWLQPLEGQPQLQPAPLPAQAQSHQAPGQPQ